MERLEGRIAVVTGGGSGMGRELVRQLASQGCDVATCDLWEDALVETETLALKDASERVRVISHVADVADESALERFRDVVVERLETDHINLLFNNAGIGGGASFVKDERAEWERTFAADWGGVYLSTRMFLPLLLAADEGHVVNTSSVNGFWACLGPMPNTAYSAAKFAIRGFTEGLIVDFRANAPHLRASVVMPGHVGTSILLNTAKAHGLDPATMDAEALEGFRARLVTAGLPFDSVPDEEVRSFVRTMSDGFRLTAPVTAAQAANVILDGVRANRWRILIGADAEALDRAVRSDPEGAYTGAFVAQLQAQRQSGAAPAEQP